MPGLVRRENRKLFQMWSLLIKIIRFEAVYFSGLYYEYPCFKYPLHGELSY